MRAFFAEGVDKMHIPWAVEGLPMLLHLSLFLFFGGLAIFLFHVDREVFNYVIGWIGLFSMVYGLITLLPIFLHNSPYHSPLSTPAWFLYAGVPHVTLKITAFITYSFGDYRTWRRSERLRDRYQWMLGGVEKAAEETTLERSSEIDIQILNWTISALGDDDSLKSFFEAIPGFFNSKLVKRLERRFPMELFKFGDVLDEFLGRTWSSNSVDDSEKARRLDISLHAIDYICETPDLFILHNILFKLRDGMPQAAETGHTLTRWFTKNDQVIPTVVQRIISRILVSMRERNDSWVTLAARVFDLPERDLRDNIALGGDSVLLASLIHVTRRYLRSNDSNEEVLDALCKLDIHNTLPGLQHDFCTLWNEIVQKTRKLGSSFTLVDILKRIRHHYTTLHQGTDAAPIAFSASTNDLDRNLRWPWSYPFCNLASHHPDSTPHLSVLPARPDNFSRPSSRPPTDGGNTASRQAEQVDNVIDPPLSYNPTTTREIGATSHDPDITPPTNPAHSSSRLTSAVQRAMAAAPQDITLAVTLSHLLEGSGQQDSDIIAPSAEPGSSQILSTGASTHTPTPTLAPIPTSLPITPSESYNAGVAPVSNSPHLAPPSIRSSIPASRPTISPTLPRLRPRGLVNTKNMCFANAVMQLLVNSPPFWNLFRELGHLKVQRGAGVPETRRGETQLVDATVRFLKEFLVEEESPSRQQQSLPDTGGTSGANEDKKDDNIVDSFEPTYLYDAMTEKRQLKFLLVRSRAHVAASCH
jgi:hypothetical protein